jgi:hypothetical protein
VRSFVGARPFLLSLTCAAAFFAVHGQVLAQWPQMFRILNMFGAFSSCRSYVGP